jgi:hypothetical protein
MPQANRVFSLAEANELVPEVSHLTAETVRMLDEVRQRHNLDPAEGTKRLPDEAFEEVETLLRSWSERVLELGANPKGYFTVDFQTLDPELLYCWTFGEEKIAFTHKVWENFNHRRPLVASLDEHADHLKWIN